eukprot:gene17307-biopygen17321
MGRRPAIHISHRIPECVGDARHTTGRTACGAKCAAFVDAGYFGTGTPAATKAAVKSDLTRVHVPAVTRVQNAFSLDFGGRVQTRYDMPTRFKRIGSVFAETCGAQQQHARRPRAAPTGAEKNPASGPRPLLQNLSCTPCPVRVRCRFPLGHEKSLSTTHTYPPRRMRATPLRQVRPRVRPRQTLQQPRAPVRRRDGALPAVRAAGGADAARAPPGSSNSAYLRVSAVRPGTCCGVCPGRVASLLPGRRRLPRGGAASPRRCRGRGARWCCGGRRRCRVFIFCVRRGSPATAQAGARRPNVVHPDAFLTRPIGRTRKPSNLDAFLTCPIGRVKNASKTRHNVCVECSMAGGRND